MRECECVGECVSVSVCVWVGIAPFMHQVRLLPYHMCPSRLGGRLEAMKSPRASSPET